jgi:hypothetical protein
LDLTNLVLAAFGVGLSLLVRVPAIDKWMQQPKFNDWRGYMMALFALLVVGALFGISCTPLHQFVPCTSESVWTLLWDWGVLFAGNQFTYMVMPPSTATVARKGA